MASSTMGTGKEHQPNFNTAWNKKKSPQPPCKVLPQNHKTILKSIGSPNSCRGESFTREPMHKVAAPACCLSFADIQLRSALRSGSITTFTAPRTDWRMPLVCLPLMGRLQGHKGSDGICRGSSVCSDTSPGHHSCEGSPLGSAPSSLALLALCPAACSCCA